MDILALFDRGCWTSSLDIDDKAGPCAVFDRILGDAEAQKSLSYALLGLKLLEAAFCIPMYRVTQFYHLFCIKATRRRLKYFPMLLVQWSKIRLRRPSSLRQWSSSIILSIILDFLGMSSVLIFFLHSTVYILEYLNYNFIFYFKLFIDFLYIIFIF